MTFTAGGNPRPPSDSIIANGVKQAWRQVPIEVTKNSVRAAGFGDWQEWHVSKHDVYGERFKTIWSSNLEEQVMDQNPDDHAQDPMNEIEEDFDEI